MLKQYLLNNINLFIIKICLVIISILVKYDCFGQQNNKRYVSTTSGIVEGHELEGLDVNEYLGIPYAEPPVGDLRFARPVPLSIRKNVTIGLKDRSEGVWCIQNASPLFKAELGPIPESEDCLHLNIWSPKQFHLYDGRPYNKLKSVIVVFHSGGFSTGSAYMETANGSQMATRDVIVVSPNYRLGPLGFYMLDPGDDSAPGNVAFYDQLLALRWIHNNIVGFGGDRNRITIFGVSTGSISVSAHIISPMSKGLFKRAIMGSGVLNWSKFRASMAKEQAIEKTRELAKRNNCSDSQSLAKCLRAVADPKQLLSLPAKHHYFEYIYPIEGTEFLPHLSKKTFEYLLYNPDIDVMAGTVVDEGSYVASFMRPEIIDSLDYKNMTMDIFHKLIDKLSQIYYNKIDIDKILGYYLVKPDASKQLLQRTFLNLIGDMLVRCPLYIFAKQLALNGDLVYFYQFNHTSTNGYDWLKTYLKTLDIETNGAIHYNDFRYYLGRPVVNREIFDELDANFSSRLLTVWTNFAKFSKPSDHWPVLLNPIKPNDEPIVKDLNPYDKTKVLINPFKNNCENIWKQYYL